MSIAASNRFARMAAGLAANGYTQVVQLAIRLAEVPILLKLWGAAGYGEWLLISAMTTALAFSDGGFTRTARREMALRAGRNDWSGVSASFQSAWALLCGLSVIFMLAVYLLVTVLPLREWLDLHSVNDTALQWALLALAMQVMVSFQSGLVHGIYICGGRYALGEMLVGTSYLLSFCGVAIGAYLGGGILGAAVGSLIGQSVGFALMLLLRQRGNGPRFGFADVSVHHIKEQLAPSFANLAFPLSDALSIQGMRLVVGLTLGPAALAVFSTLRTLCRTATQPVLSIARTLEPELSIAYGAGEPAKSASLFIRASHAGFWLAISVAMGVLIFGPIFYAIWGGGKLQLDWPTLLLLLVASVANVIWGIGITVPNSVNKHGLLAWRFLLIVGVGGVALSYSLCAASGSIWGAALAVAISDVIAVRLALLPALKIADIPVSAWLNRVTSHPLNLVNEVVAMALAGMRRRLLKEQ